MQGSGGSRMRVRGWLDAFLHCFQNGRRAIWQMIMKKTRYCRGKRSISQLWWGPGRLPCTSHSMLHQLFQIPPTNEQRATHFHWVSFVLVPPAGQTEMFSQQQSSTSSVITLPLPWLPGLDYLPVSMIGPSLFMDQMPLSLSVTPFSKPEN